MPSFRVEAVNDSGSTVVETGEAESAGRLCRDVESRGWKVLSVETLAPSNDSATRASDVPSSQLFGQRPLRAGDLITLGEERGGMARASLPLDQALGSLAREMGLSRLKSAVNRLADDLRAGKTLSEALAAQRGAIPEIYAA